MKSESNSVFSSEESAQSWIALFTAFGPSKKSPLHFKHCSKIMWIWIWKLYQYTVLWIWIRMDPHWFGSPAWHGSKSVGYRTYCECGSGSRIRKLSIDQIFQINLIPSLFKKACAFSPYHLNTVQYIFQCCGSCRIGIILADLNPAESGACRSRSVPYLF